MGGLDAGVKLFEVLSDRYTEQFEESAHVITSCTIGYNLSSRYGPVRYYGHFGTSFSRSHRDYPSAATPALLGVLGLKF